MIKIIILTFLVFVDLSYTLKEKNTFYSSNFTNADIIGVWQGSGRDRSVNDFTEADRIPDGEFNKIIWYAVKDLDAEYPGTRRAVFLKVLEDKG